MNKFAVLVIDSFGVGAMGDVPEVRPQDIGANTCGHILQQLPNLQLPMLEKLGLINVLHIAEPYHRFSALHESPTAAFGVALLQHEGGDTFMGHQEIMGTLPLPPVRMPFSTVLEKVEQALKAEGFKVDHYQAANSELSLLWVNDAVAIGDNLEADLGQVFNVCGNLSVISFEQLEKIGRVVRSRVEVGRVIAYGGLLESSEQILAAVEVKDNRFIGVNSPKAGVYQRGFQVIHLGYGVDASVQVPQQLHQQGVLTVLVGKVADIVENPQGRNYQQLVDSQTILDITLDELQRPEPAFICTNIQETDLAGHAQDVARYAERLQLVDASLAKLISAMDESDCLVVMADHGNDPTVGHSKHTREQVPLLVFRTKQAPCSLGIRTTLSDVGATVCEFFNAKAPYNGRSFLAALNAAGFSSDK